MNVKDDVGALTAARAGRMAQAKALPSPGAQVPHGWKRKLDGDPLEFLLAPKPIILSS